MFIVLLATQMGQILGLWKIWVFGGKSCWLPGLGGLSVWIWRLPSSSQVISLGDSPLILDTPLSPSLMFESLHFLVQYCSPWIIKAPPVCRALSGKKVSSGLCDITELCLVEWEGSLCSRKQPFGVNSFCFV